MCQNSKFTNWKDKEKHTPGIRTKLFKIKYTKKGKSQVLNKATCWENLSSVKEHKQIKSVAERKNKNKI